jgi:quercetin dioxygenase-like cupin family protein
MPVSREAARVVAVPPGQGEHWWFGGSLFEIKVSAAQSGGAMLLFEATGPQGKASPLHAHPAEDETFYVLEGELRVHVDGVEHDGGPGTVLFVPRGIPHAYVVLSETARFLNILTPGSAEAFYRDGGEPATSRVLPPAGPLPIERIRASAARNGHEILGPPPFAVATPTVA